MAAAVRPGNTGRLALLVDEVTGMQFLVDTGAVFSVLPYTSSELPTGPKITTADKSPIPCWGWVQQRILAGGGLFFIFRGRPQATCGSGGAGHLRP